MSGLFSVPKIKPPKPVRMPTEQDPEVRAAAERARMAARGRSGRESTILTEGLRGLTGSSGLRLGA